MHPSIHLRALTSHTSHTGRLQGKSRLILWIIIALLFAPVVSKPTQAAAPLPAFPLALGLNVDEAFELGKDSVAERKIAGGEVHLYRVRLLKEQFLRLEVEARSADLSLVLMGPDKVKLTQVEHGFGTQTPKYLFWVAATEGEHYLEVRLVEKGARSADYTLRVMALRQSAPPDRKLLAAQLKFLEAQRAFEKRSAAAYQEALKKYEEARSLNKEAGEPVIEAAVLGKFGEIHYSLGKRKEALDFFLQALPLWRATGNRSGVADILNNIGMSYNALRDQQRALDYVGQALKLRRELEDRFGESRVLNNLGGISRDYGDKQRALDYYNQALPILRSVGDRKTEAAILNNIGAVYRDLGESQKGFEALFQALSLRRAVQDKLGEAGTLHNIGLSYRAVGDMTTALDYFNQSIVIVRELGDKRAEGASLNSVGSAYDALGEKQQALEHYMRALELLSATNDRVGEARAHNNIGRIYDALGKKETALDYFKKALALSEAIQDRDSRAQALAGMGELLLSTGKEREAFEALNRALTLQRELVDLRGEARTLITLARMERERGQLDAARTRAAASLAIVESLRGRMPGEALRGTYFASVLKSYEFYIDILMRLNQSRPREGFDAQALAASERARARSLLEVLGEDRSRIRQGVDAQLLEREGALRQLINGKAERQTRLLSGRYTPEQATEAEAEIRKLIEEYQQVQTRILATSPQYAALTQPAPTDIREIQQKVLDSETVLLEYALGEERSYVWLLTQTSIQGFELPARAEIERRAQLVYRLLTSRQDFSAEAGQQQGGRPQMPQANEEDYKREAAALSRILLGPFIEQLGTRRLLIVADGALQYIPFAALPVVKPNIGGGVSTAAASSAESVPLGVEHEIVGIPSASTLYVLRSETAARRPAARSVIVFADPVFEQDDPRVKNSLRNVAARSRREPAAAPLTRAAREGFRFSRLPGTRYEAKVIRESTPRREASVALDFAADRRRVTSAELGQYRIVHFATHGFLNTKYPSLSGIALSLVDERGEEQDGFLRLQDIYNLKIPAELVVLSACSTGLGHEVRGEGLVGLTRGFMYAGAKRVVASLWKVDDEATAELMRRFYQKMLLEKQRPGAALRAAQAEMWQQRRWQSPYYWAAFVLQGEWR